MVLRQSRPTRASPRCIVATALIFGFFGASVYAATDAGTRCDSALPPLPDLPIALPVLPADVTDIGVLRAEDISSVVAPLESPVPRLHSLAPYSEVLEQKAHEGSARLLPATTSSETPGAPPLAGAKIPGDDLDTADSPDVESAESVPVPGVTTRLPGVSDEDLSRFRQQMYRTDI